MFITIHWIHCFLLSLVCFFSAKMKTTQNETKLKPPGAPAQLFFEQAAERRKKGRAECLFVRVDGVYGRDQIGFGALSRLV
jgi:hypothetical protein